MFDIKNNSNDDVEVWNKSLLGFFLAVHNEQIKTANLFLKAFDLLRAILYKICPNRFSQNQDEHQEHNTSSPNLTTLFKQKFATPIQLHLINAKTK